MRLDSYIVKKGYLGSRGRAKRAIIEGQVKVNDSIINTPSFDVGYTDKIKITEGQDKPAGYWKLKSIQEKTDLIKKGDNVLDIGSSAGGFLLYASSVASRVHGIEFSSEFRDLLEKIANERTNITIEFADVFTITLWHETYDVLLMDITAKPNDSLKALGNVLPGLKRGGMLLQVIKLPEKRDIEQIIPNLSSMNLKIVHIIEEQKKEIYIIARKL